MQKLFIPALITLFLLSACATTNDSAQLPDDYSQPNRTSSRAANDAATMMSPLTHY